MVKLLYFEIGKIYHLVSSLHIRTRRSPVKRPSFRNLEYVYMYITEDLIRNLIRLSLFYRIFHPILGVFEKKITHAMVSAQLGIEPNIGHAILFKFSSPPSSSLSTSHNHQQVNVVMSTENISPSLLIHPFLSMKKTPQHTI